MEKRIGNWKVIKFGKIENSKKEKLKRGEIYIEKMG